MQTELFADTRPELSEAEEKMIIELVKSGNSDSQQVAMIFLLERGIPFRVVLVRVVLLLLDFDFARLWDAERVARHLDIIIFGVRLEICKIWGKPTFCVNRAEPGTILHEYGIDEKYNAAAAKKITAALVRHLQANGRQIQHLMKLEDYE